MNERYEYVLKLLNEHKSLMEYIANRLLEIETMDGKEFYEIIKAEGHCKDLISESTEIEENKSENDTQIDNS